MLILATAAVLAIAGWFVLGESESVIAAEGHQPLASEAPTAAHGDHGDHGDQQDHGDSVLATVDGEPISETRTLNTIQGQLLALDRQRHALISEALDAEIKDALIVSEAAKRGISTEELMRIEVAEKATALPDETIDAFYQDQVKQRGGRAPAQADIEGDIRQYLALEAFHQRLQEAADIRKTLEPFRVDVAALGPAKGSADAPVTLIIFSDFECPYCSRVTPVLDQVAKTYGDQVRVVFRQFPLERLHPSARRAGLASLCAHEQGQFWPMHDALFADQRRLRSGLESIAARVEGLDPDAFRQCLADARFDDLIARDLEDGARVGVTGTPAMFVNGRFMNGVVPFDQLSAVIEEELATPG